MPGDYRILGPLEVTRDGCTVALNGSRRRALVARLLVARGRVVSQDQLVDDLWGERPPDNAVGTLHSYVSKARQRLGADVLVRRVPGYAIDIGPDDLDADRFESAAVQALHHRADDHAVLDDVRAALSLWRGPALGEFADHRWAQGEATRLHELRIQALQRCVEAELAAGRHQVAVAELEVLVQDHPLDERFWELLALAHYRCGRQADALRTLARAREVLVDEAGLEPGAALRSLERRVLDQDEDLHARPEPVAADATVPDLPAPLVTAGGTLPWLAEGRGRFVGRHDERRTAHELAAATRPGRPHLMLITGEAGIGKTRLANELALELHRAGAVVLFGRCDLAATVPYQPFDEAIGRALDPHHSLLAAAPSAAVPPSPFARGAGAGPRASDGDQLRLFDEVESVLTRLAGHRLVVLVIDDLQWAEAGTLALLRHLLRPGGTGPAVLLLATARHATTAGDQEVRRTLVELLRHDGVARVELAGLGRAEVAELVAERRQLAGAAGDGPPPLVDRLQGETAGNPFFVHAVLDQFGDGEVWRGDGPDVDAPFEVPPAVRDVIEGRVAQRSDACRRMLSGAAVAGTVFDALVVGTAVGLEETDLLEAVEEAAAAGIIQVSDPVSDQYRFVHGLVRDVVYDSLVPSRRLRIHRDVALALEAVRAGDLAPHLRQLADHFGQASSLGYAGRALDYSAEAARLAMDRLAFRDAAGVLEGAVSAADEGGPEERARRCRLLADLGEAYTRSGAEAQGAQALARAAEEAMALGSGPLVADVALRRAGPVAVGVEPSPGAVELLRRAVAWNPEPGPTRALLLSRLGHLVNGLEPRQESFDLTAEALVMAEEAGDDRALAQVLVHRYWCLYGPDHTEERLAIAERISRLASDLDDAELALLGAQCQAHLWLELGDHEAAAEAARRRTEMADALQQPYYLWFSRNYEAMMAATEGRFDDAEARGAAALRLRESAAPVHAMHVFAALLVEVRWLQGRMAEIRPMCDQLLASEPDRMIWRSLAVMVGTETGDDATARAHLAWYRSQDLAAVPRDFDWWPVMFGMAMGAARHGPVDLADRIYDQLAPFSGRNCMIGQSGFYGAVDLHLGGLAARSGRAALAAQHLAAALDQHQRTGAVPFVALTQAALADLIDAHPELGATTGDPRALRSAAVATAERLSMAALLARQASAGGADRPGPPAGEPGRGQTAASDPGQDGS